MPLVEKPVAFDSVDFLPGFPSLSTFGCNPWSRDYRAGACASAPTAIGRENSTLPASDFIARAMAEAGVGPASFMSDIKRGVVPAALAGIGSNNGGAAHHSRGSISGCGCGGSCGGGCGGALSGVGGNSGSAHHSHGSASGCGCGGTCGGCGGGLGDYGFPDFEAVAADPLAFLKANLFPIALGAALVFMLKRK